MEPNEDIKLIEMLQDGEITLKEYFSMNETYSKDFIDFCTSNGMELSESAAEAFQTHLIEEEKMGM